MAHPWKDIKKKFEQAENGDMIPVDNIKEFDPDGLELSEPGAKLDLGKIKAGLLEDFSRALWAVAEVATFGCEVKGYAEGGWQHVGDGINRYKHAKWRHLLKRKWELLDDESKLDHLKHQAWNALAELELFLRKEEDEESKEV
jgi:hypothetical protein